MRAVRLHGYGTPDVLTCEEIPVPDPRDDEVLVKVSAAAVNPVDCKIRAGSHRAIIRPKLPVTLGMDLSGVVQAVGRKVRSFQAGDEVFASPNHHMMGAYADFAVVRQDELAHKPKSVDHAEAASLPLVALTAWDALVRRGKLERGERVLIQAGAGGVGSIAIQLAKHLGAEVFTTASPRNHELVRSLGADVVIDHRSERYESVAKDCDLLIESLGPSHWPRALETVRKGGRIIGLTTGLPDASERFGPALGFLFAVGQIAMFLMRARLSKGVRFIPMSRAANGKALADIAELVDAGVIRPVVDSTLPLKEAAEGHRRVETGRSRGKVVLLSAS